MNKLIAITTGLLITSSAFANTITLSKNANLSTASYTTKAEAINAGFDLTDQLANNNQNELRQEFRIVEQNQVRNITVTNTEIKTEEFAVARDAIQYRAIVKVNYQFETKDSD